MQPNLAHLIKTAGSAFCASASTLQNSDTLKEAGQIARSYEDLGSLTQALKEQ